MENTVDAGGLKPNTWQRFERLGSAGQQAKLGIEDEPYGDAEGEPGVVAKPRRRARTPLDKHPAKIRRAPITRKQPQAQRKPPNPKS